MPYCTYLKFHSIDSIYPSALFTVQHSLPQAQCAMFRVQCVGIKGAKFFCSFGPRVR